MKLLNPAKPVTTMRNLCIAMSSVFVSSLVTPAGTALADDALYDALSGGKVDFSARYRYEAVDDESNTLPEADAHTVRLTLGYKTGSFYGFRAYGQLEHVQALQEDYNDGGTNGKLFDTVVDPEGTEINQGYISYEGLDKTLFKYGRQIITYRQAPKHRFIGTVGWRQNWQTFDGFTVSNSSLENTTLSAGYIYNVNRIFGEDHPTNSDASLNGYLFNAQYTGLPYVNLEAYAYLLDYDTPNAFNVSNKTFGIRGWGKTALTETTNFLYAAELANQSDYQTAFNQDNNYYMAEVGLWHKVGVGFIDSVVAKLSYEVMEGDLSEANAPAGGSRFVTPLATLHAYQGWADRFLNNPAAGMEDAYLTLVANLAYDMKFLAIYHDFSANDASFDYGTEIDLQLTKKFMKHYTAGIKYAAYDADTNAGNVGATASDVDKFWVFAQVSF